MLSARVRDPQKWSGVYQANISHFQFPVESVIACFSLLERLLGLIFGEASLLLEELLFARG